MKKKVTISIDEKVCDGLLRRIGKRRISWFFETLVRQHVVVEDLENGYRALAADEQDAAEALEWTVVPLAANVSRLLSGRGIRYRQRGSAQGACDTDTDYDGEQGARVFVNGANIAGGDAVSLVIETPLELE